MSELMEIPKGLLDIPVKQAKTVQEMLMSRQSFEQLAMVSTAHLNASRMMRIMSTAMRTTPKLKNCDPLTLLGAMMQCAALGLEPNTVLGHAYLIPFENRSKGTVDVQLVVGYRGLIDLARRSGHITSIHAGIHYSDDELWDYEEGTEARLRHKPGSQEGKKLHAYAIAKFVEGGHAYVVLPWSQVLRIRNGSQGYQNAVRRGQKDNPWMAHEDAMAKKTAIRSLAKYLPLSVEFIDAVQMDGHRADFASFAKYPEDGLTIDGEVDAEEQTPEPAEDPKPKEAPKPKTEPKPKAEAKPKAEPERQADPKEPEPKAEKEVEMKAAAEEPATENGDPTAHPLYAEVQQILPDVGPSTIRVGMEKQFNEIRASRPDVWDAIEALLALAEENDGDDPEFADA